MRMEEVKFKKITKTTSNRRMKWKENSFSLRLIWLSGVCFEKLLFGLSRPTMSTRFIVPPRFNSLYNMFCCCSLLVVVVSFSAFLAFWSYFTVNKDDHERRAISSLLLAAIWISWTVVFYAFVFLSHSLFMLRWCRTFSWSSAC
jgi:hypothetical protein